MDDQTANKAFNVILSLGREQKLASYDSAYLELAMRLNIPLATSDTRLIAAANVCGINLFV